MKIQENRKLNGLSFNFIDNVSFKYNNRRCNVRTLNIGSSGDKRCFISVGYGNKDNNDWSLHQMLLNKEELGELISRLEIIKEKLN